MVHQLGIGVLVLWCGCYSEHEYLLESSTLATVRRLAHSHPTGLVRAQRNSDKKPVHVQLATLDLRAKPASDGKWLVRSRAMSGMTVAGTILVSCGLLLGGAGVGVKAKSTDNILADPLIVFGVVPSVLGVLFLSLGPSARPAEIEVPPDDHPDDFR